MKAEFRNPVAGPFFPAFWDQFYSECQRLGRDVANGGAGFGESGAGFLHGQEISGMLSGYKMRLAMKLPWGLMI